VLYSYPERITLEITILHIHHFRFTKKDYNTKYSIVQRPTLLLTLIKRLIECFLNNPFDHNGLRAHPSRPITLRPFIIALGKAWLNLCINRDNLYKDKWSAIHSHYAPY
jgi:hypothetical protein